jgi:hypothetical protein
LHVPDSGGSLRLCVRQDINVLLNQIHYHRAEEAKAIREADRNPLN